METHSQNMEINFHKMGNLFHNMESYFYIMDMNRTNIYINGTKKQIVY